METIICPNCKETIEISQAFKHQIEEQVRAEEQAKRRAELEKVRQEAQEKATKKIKETLGFEMKQAHEELVEKEERIKTLIDQITLQTQELRISKREREEAKLQMQKKLAQEEDKIRQEARKKAQEEQHLKLLEKDKQLQDALAANEDMRRKLQQGSQQTQGEVFELEFENMLVREFPNDKIKEVVKGAKGADLVQEVWDRNANKCGTILWEIKNTKIWNEQWIEKLKADQRAIMADYVVLISEVVPSEIDTARYYKNVWVTKRNFVIGLACALRMNLIQISMAKKSHIGQKEKKDVLYSYVSSTEFRLRIEAIIGAFSNMQSEIEKEKRYFSSKWARDEKNIRQVIDNTYGMHGDLKGIIGATLPEIKGLDLLESGDEEK